MTLPTRDDAGASATGATTAADAAATDVASLFPGDGEMAARCRAVDWSHTPLGPASGWPPALRVAVRTVMECAFPICVWCGPDNILVYNDAYLVVLGSKHPRALARPVREVWAEIWPDITAMLERIGQGERVFGEDARFIMERADGPPGEAWFTFSLSPVRDERGALVGYLNVAAETTTRVLAERAAEEARAQAERAERRLREIFEQTPGFLAVLQGPGHVFEFANPAYSQLVGYRQIIGRRVGDALPEVVGQGFIDLLDDVFRSGKAFVGREVPVRLERVPGATPEERVVDFVYQPIAGADGATTGIVVQGTDVSEAVLARREIERLLGVSEEARASAEESEKRYRFLANAIPVQVWTATADGRLDYVSDRTAEYLGVTSESVLGDAWFALLHPDDVGDTGERWARSIESGQDYETEFRLRHAGTDVYRWHLARATPQRDDEGRILRWFGTNTDIEDRRRAEAELERLTSEATEASRAKSDFLAAMSHELRTPLNAIGGYAQLIDLGVRGPVTEEQRLDLSRILRSKNHLDALVSDVLNFAKAGSGRIDYRIERVEVARTLRSVLEMVLPQAAEKELTLESPEAPRDLCISADEDRTHQILLNLLANALKFTKPGGTVSLTTTATDADVAIAVSDTGIGVPADELDRIFEPFVQADRALNSTDQGVGLGLAISRQLARAMGGDLVVASEVGHGATFTLTLPRCL